MLMQIHFRNSHSLINFHYAAQKAFKISNYGLLCGQFLGVGAFFA